MVSVNHRVLSVRLPKAGGDQEGVSSCVADLQNRRFVLDGVIKYV